MTNIVTFTPRPARKNAGAMRLDAPARVVIFPGVRYERTGPAKTGQAGGPAKMAREPSTPGTT